MIRRAERKAKHEEIRRKYGKWVSVVSVSGSGFTSRTRWEDLARARARGQLFILVETLWGCPIRSFIFV